MKPLMTFLVLFLSFLNFSQNVIDVSISKIGIFSKYGKDSLHLMIKKSECGEYSKTYTPVNLKLVINKSEKRIYRLPNDFNHKIYRNLYKDLAQLNDKELELHYLKNGINEKRVYKIPDDFNHVIYRTLYKDLAKLNDKELELHYLKNGINEKRVYKIPEDKPKLNLKNDINEKIDCKIPEDKPKLNLKNDINEKIDCKIPNDFNHVIYRTLYKDLSQLNDKELELHYLKNGINEKRVYK